MDCVICHLPLKDHSLYQLRNCESLRISMINISELTKLVEKERKQLTQNLTKDNDNANG
jgi:hypothetical protein